MFKTILVGQGGGRQTNPTRLFAVHLAFALTLLIVGASHAPASGKDDSRRALSLRQVELKVHGVGLGASYARVRRQLGKPRVIKREKDLDDTCYPPHRVLTLVYDGLTIELFGGLERDDFQVVAIGVTSSKWLITPGIRIGKNEQAARLRLGAQPEETDATGDRKLRYVNKGNDGFAMLQFQDDRLVKVSWESALC